MKNYRNNQQYIVGFIDALIEEFDASKGPFLHKLGGFEIDVELQTQERTEITIFYNVVDQPLEDDFEAKIILIPETTSINGFRNLVELAVDEIISKIEEVQND